MNKNTVILFLISISIGFVAGMFYDYKNHNERLERYQGRLLTEFFSTTAYASSLSLSTEVGMHQLIKDGRIEEAKKLSLYRINTYKEQIEKIDYKGSIFKSEIEESLSKANAYLETVKLTEIE